MSSRMAKEGHGCFLLSIIGGERRRREGRRQDQVLSREVLGGGKKGERGKRGESGRRDWEKAPGRGFRVIPPAGQKELRPKKKKKRGGKRKGEYGVK